MLINLQCKNLKALCIGCENHTLQNNHETFHLKGKSYSTYIFQVQEIPQLLNYLNLIQ